MQKRLLRHQRFTVMDDDESKEIIVHKTLSENQYKDVSELECNIVQKTLSQENSVDVPENVSTELKGDDNNEHSVIEKSYKLF